MVGTSDGSQSVLNVSVTTPVALEVMVMSRCPGMTPFAPALRVMVPEMTSSSSSCMTVGTETTSISDAADVGMTRPLATKSLPLPALLLELELLLLLLLSLAQPANPANSRRAKTPADLKTYAKRMRSPFGFNSIPTNAAHLNVSEKSAGLNRKAATSSPVILGNASENNAILSFGEEAIEDRTKEAESKIPPHSCLLVSLFSMSPPSSLSGTSFA